MSSCRSLWPQEVTYDSTYYECQLEEGHVGRHMHTSDTFYIAWEGNPYLKVPANEND